MQTKTSNARDKNIYGQIESFSLRDYLRIVTIRKWLVLAIFIVSIGISIYYLAVTPPSYRTRVLIMREETNRTFPESFMSLSPMMDTWDKGEELILKSFSSLREIKEKIYKKHGFTFDIHNLSDNISLSNYEESSRILELKVSSDTPEKARTLANTAAEIYIKNTGEIESNRLKQGLNFMKQQMIKLEEKIQETEKALSNFSSKEGLVLTNNLASNNLIDRLGVMQSELIKTESDIELTKTQLQSVDELIAEKKKYSRSSSVAELSPQIDQIQERLITLQLELSTKRETLKEKDPEIISLQRKIDVMQKQLKTEFDKLLETPEIKSFDPISEIQALMQQSITLNVDLKKMERKAELLKERMKKFELDHPELISKHIELSRLERQARIYEQTYTDLMTKYEDMLLLEQMKGNGLEIIDEAFLPSSPVNPGKTRVLAAGVIIGLSMGILSAILLELLDDSIKRKEDVEQYMELPVIGTIPRIDGFNTDKSKNNIIKNNSEKFDKNVKEIIRHIVLYSPKEFSESPWMESYRNLSANIRYHNVDKPIKSLLITSAMPQEGKTTTSSNLAVVMAQTGVKILLIDSDMRRPKQNIIFQQNRKPGLSDLLLSDNNSESINFESYIRPTQQENLYLLTAGDHFSDSNKLITSGKMQKLVNDLKQDFDLIIMDSPPLMLASDSITLSKIVDGTIIVLNSGNTKRKIGIQAREILEGVEAEIIGAILNNVDYSKQYGNYYYNYRYYKSYYDSKN
ncbi:polysaccharide biosynthesis tyrosine autokinase [Candidatus Poribacteria bacterium]|nr:polysaccharide biosynthesis tyrosine autokinase [Candidatus Poribacteria bacterium]